MRREQSNRVHCPQPGASFTDNDSDIGAKSTDSLCIIALLRDADRRRHLVLGATELASAGEATVRFAADWTELRELAQRGAALAVVNPYVDGATSVTECQEFLRLFEAIPVVAFCPARIAFTRDLIALIRDGMQDVIPNDVTANPRALHDRLEEAICSHLAVRVQRALPTSVTQHVRSALTHIVQMARNPGIGVESVARSHGWSVSTFRRRLAEAGLLPPGQLIQWARLLNASLLLQDRGRTLESVARQLGYGDASGLSHAMRRRTGLSARVVLERGGVEVLLPLCVRQPCGDDCAG